MGRCDQLDMASCSCGSGFAGETTPVFSIVLDARWPSCEGVFNLQMRSRPANNKNQNQEQEDHTEQEEHAEAKEAEEH